MKRLGIPLCAALFALSTWAQPESDLIPFWNASDESSTDSVDHGAWQDILTAHLVSHPSGINRFDYGALKAAPDDLAQLNRYLDSLQAVDPRSLARAEQFPYWINFYNALTVKVVTDAYPVDSIRKISESWIPLSGPWGDVHANVAGEDLTLDNIEHGILRPIWKDPRIHYAVNCASLGCPNLATTAYTAENVESLLEAGARDYVNHTRGVDLIDEEFMVLSSIYDWFVVDFGDSEEGVLVHIKKYANDDLAAALEGFEGGMDYEYDWDLNQP